MADDGAKDVQGLQNDRPDDAGEEEEGEFSFAFFFSYHCMSYRFAMQSSFVKNLILGMDDRKLVFDIQMIKCHDIIRMKLVHVGYIGPSYSMRFFLIVTQT